MGHSRKSLPSGIAEIAEAIGDRAALELILWRWARAAERALARGQVPPRSIAVHVPIRAALDHPIVDALGPEAAEALSASLPGETIACQIPEWLLDHYVIRAGLGAMAAGATADMVARRYGKHPSAWSRLWQARNRKPRSSPLDDVGENVAQEVVALLLLRNRQFVPLAVISANLT